MVKVLFLPGCSFRCPGRSCLVSPAGNHLIFNWQRRNNLPRNPALEIPDCIELIKPLTRNYSQDNGYHGWRNHVLECQDVTICRESEIIDDLFWELKEAFKQRLATGTLPDLT